MYNNCKIYGPYTRKDGRQHIIVLFSNKIRKTVSYPKYLVEVFLNRSLNKDETVDHIDGNFNNNSLDNLQILSRKDHVVLDVKRFNSITFTCPICKCKFTLRGIKLHYKLSNMKRNNSAAFCSRKCAGIYGQKLQSYKIKHLNSQTIIKTYYTNKSD